MIQNEIYSSNILCIVLSSVNITVFGSRQVFDEMVPFFFTVNSMLGLVN